MKANNVLGIIFSNMHDDKIVEMTASRTMGSIPYGGRYRLIDFALSGMVNSDIKTVGVVTKRNYQSLMDHLGSGKAWDLSRKRDGLFILPPFGSGNDVYKTRMEALYGILSFLRGAKQDYVVMTDSNIVAALDFQKLLEFHKESGADITVGYKKMPVPESAVEPLILSDIDKNGKIKEVLIGPDIDGEGAVGVNIYAIGREFLIEKVNEAISRDQRHFGRVIQRSTEKYNIYAYEFTGHMDLITSMNSYFESNMSLQRDEVRKSLFTEAPVYTKLKDDMPAVYGLGAKVSNSMIADGCVIDGTVENSVLFRGVTVHKGAHVSNCIVMQGSEIGAGSILDYAVLDKDVIVGENRMLKGAQSHPHYIGKRSVV